VSSPKHDPSVYTALAETGLTNYDIADKLGVGEASVRRGLRKAGFTRVLRPLPATARGDEFLDRPIRHHGPIAVSADWHIPLVDYPYANRFLEHCRSEEITTLAIAGDFFNHDALSSFDYKQASANLRTELREAQHIMESLVEQFNRIIFIWGNHDARFHKALQYQISFSSAMRLCFGELGEDALKKIEFSNLDHFWVNDETYICHPKNYTQTPLSTARKLAGKVQANVITAHSHHAAMGFDVSGRFVCVEAGGFFDASRTAYLQRSTTFPTWAQGYSLIDADGHIAMYTPRWAAHA
jgi:predicted phosphodiesterase